MNKMNQGLKICTDYRLNDVRAEIVAMADKMRRLGVEDWEEQMLRALFRVSDVADFCDDAIFDRYCLVKNSKIDKIRKIPFIGKKIIRSLGLE